MEAPRRLEPQHRATILVLVGLLLTLGFASIDEYNVTWDEALGDMFFGQRYLSYFTSRDAKYLDIGADPYPIERVPNLEAAPFRSRPWEYYPFANTAAAATAELLSRRMNLVADWFDGFHAFNLLLAALFVPIWFVFLFRRLGELEALLGVLLLFTAPRVVVELLSNTKDFPEMVLFALGAVAFFAAYERGSVGGIVAAGALGGAALATKANALFLPPILLVVVLAARLPERFAKRRSRLVLALGLAALAGVAVFFASWPYLWSAPIENLRRHFDYVAGQVRQVRPESLLSPLLAVLYTTPIPWLVLAVLGLVPAVRGAARREAMPILALAWVAVTLGRMYLPGAVNFDGVRHFLELFPALALLGAMGGGFALRQLDRLRSRWPPRKLSDHRAQQLLAITLLLVAIVPQGWATVRSHPHQIAYWNVLVGGTSGAFARGLPQAGDYWALGYRQGLRWLEKNAERDSFLAVPVVEHAVLAVAQTRLRSDIGLLHTSVPVTPHIPADVVDRVRRLGHDRVVYVMFALREDWTNEMIEDCRARLRPIAEWQLDGAPLVQIYRYR